MGEAFLAGNSRRASRKSPMFSAITIERVSSLLRRDRFWIDFVTVFSRKCDLRVKLMTISLRSGVQHCELLSDTILDAYIRLHKWKISESSDASLA